MKKKPFQLPPKPLFDEATHTLRNPETGERLVSLTTALGAAGFGSEWWGDEQSMLRGKRVHKACHYDDEGDLDLSTVIESDQGYLLAWRAIRNQYRMEILAVERPLMAPHIPMACIPDVLCKALINGVMLYTIAERKTGAIPPHVRIQLAGQQMMCPDPFRWTRIAFELHADGTWKVGGPWHASGYMADKRVVEASYAIYQSKKELGIL